MELDAARAAQYYIVKGSPIIEDLIINKKTSGKRNIQCRRLIFHSTRFWTEPPNRIKGLDMHVSMLRSQAQAQN